MMQFISGTATVGALVIGIYLLISQLFSDERKPAIEIELQCNQVENIQVFYDIGMNFNINDSRSTTIKAGSDFQIVQLELPQDGLIRNLRIDLGALPSQYQIKRISFVDKFRSKDLYATDIIKSFKTENDISEFQLRENLIEVTTTGEDPIILSNFDISKLSEQLKKAKPDRTVPILISFIISISVFIILYKRIKSVQLKPSRLLLITGFISCIGAPFYMMMTGIVKQDNNEFRTKSTLPNWKMPEWDEYLKKYNAYFEDNFGFRNDLIYYYAKYKMKIWNSSSIPDKVLVGKEKWLFTVEDSLMEDYRGLRKFTPQQLEEIYFNLIYRKKRLDQMGIKYYILVAPNKQTIYSEFIPGKYTKVDPQTRWEQTKNYLQSKGIDFVIDPTDDFMKEKNTSQLYYKTDLHWNNMGAYFASNKLLTNIQKDVPAIKTHPLGEYQRTEVLFTKGDMSRMIGYKGIHDMDYEFKCAAFDAIQYLPGPVYPSYVSTQPVILTINNDTTKPNLVVYRDSFGNGMIQFISQESNRAVYIWTHVFDWAIIEQEKPDIVIHEISEKLIHKFLEE